MSHPDVVDHVARSTDDTPLDEKKSSWNVDVDDVQILDAKEFGDADDSNRVIVTGEDVSKHLLSLRDDFDPSLTVSSMIIGTILAAAQATMDQIGSFRPASMDLSKTLILIVSWLFGRAVGTTPTANLTSKWARFLPRGDVMEEKWRAQGGQGKLPLRIRLAKIFNPTSFGIKEHAIAVLTATSASHGTASISVFTVQILIYEQHLSAATVILSTLSIGLFGYGLTGLLQPFTVWPSESVYWTNIPTVHTLQSFHWDNWATSKRMRWFWICAGAMALYEIIPAYIFPYLNAVSIPCLASMNVKNKHTASILTNLFGGSISNEGLGLFALSFDWNNIGQVSLPLKWQFNSGLGFLAGYIILMGIYYSNAWNSRDLPFMSANLLNKDGTRYTVQKIFENGILNRKTLGLVGLPVMAGSYVWMQMSNNMAIGGMFAHVVLFWGPDLVKGFKSIREKDVKKIDPHHAHMMEHYQPAPWWWFASIMLFSFVLGIVAVCTGHVDMPVWAYIVALVFGSIIAPFTNLLYSRFNSGVDTNNICKMLAGAVLPGRPIGNLYFASWSHNVIQMANYLAMDLKIGEYLKIPPRVMVATQVWGTVLGAFIHYVVMISIVNSHRDILLDNNGNYMWSGVTYQSLSNKAATWALAKDMYAVGKPYVLVPCGLAIGAGLVIVYYLFCRVVPKLGRWNTNDLNLPTAFIYSGQLAVGANSTLLSGYMVGFISQYFIRNYRPRFFKKYLWILSGALDTGASFVMFILAFAVYGAAGKARPFPTWWGNLTETAEFLDHCPNPKHLK